MLDAISGSSDFSFLTFSWEGEEDDATCIRIGFSTQSFYLPKKLDDHIKGKSGKSGKSDK